MPVVYTNNHSEAMDNPMYGGTGMVINSKSFDSSEIKINPCAADFDDPCSADYGDPPNYDDVGIEGSQKTSLYSTVRY